MPKNKFKLCAFREEVKKRILADSELVVKIANMVNSTIVGVEIMVRTNSQTLFHISVIEAISSSLKLDHSQIKKCKR